MAVSSPDHCRLPAYCRERVFHILGPGKIAPANLTKVARPRPDGALIYPNEATPEKATLPP